MSSSQYVEGDCGVANWSLVITGRPRIPGCTCQRSRNVEKCVYTDGGPSCRVSGSRSVQVDPDSAGDPPNLRDHYPLTSNDYLETAVRYEANPKHKEPWQRGARGSLCPRDVDAPGLLAASEVDPAHPGKRYATDGVRAYCGHEHAPECWHGFPIEWRKVPEKIRQAWLATGNVSRRDMRRHW